MNLSNAIKRLFTKRKDADINSAFNLEKEIKLTDQDGESFVFRGEQKNDEPNGFGEAIFESGDVYLGYFKNRKREGIGMYKWESGDYYVGEWSNNKRQGFGINYVKDFETVIFGEFDGVQLMRESGSITKRLHHDHCVICGKNKKLVKALIAGGIQNRAICDGCTVTALQALKKEMKYSKAELLTLIDDTN
ncbi:MORN repeat protein [Kordia sp. SMS9]|uniref:ClpX C4-type zinc finger protein n=1 Tax=Kordia sp. SMS9 TaxID=2282170 RepID=UPI000E0D4504|nr:ClpX C4-type zinc finger protein [Kordia sp. SMS9]AXG69816.1 MORN repeat protein [Kordia sp. SMS9]